MLGNVILSSVVLGNVNLSSIGLFGNVILCSNFATTERYLDVRICGLVISQLHLSVSFVSDVAFCKLVPVRHSLSVTVANIGEL